MEYLRKKTPPITRNTPAIHEKRRTPTKPSQSMEAPSGRHDFAGDASVPKGVGVSRDGGDGLEGAAGAGGALWRAGASTATGNATAGFLSGASDRGGGATGSPAGVPAGSCAGTGAGVFLSFRSS
jgi:hypothetical protein